jgi:hypothetical protein
MGESDVTKGWLLVSSSLYMAFTYNDKDNILVKALKVWLVSLRSVLFYLEHKMVVISDSKLTASSRIIKTRVDHIILLNECMVVFKKRWSA